jgi:hypothetical protein
MRLTTIALATALTTMTSLAFAQAPIGSSADFGNGAVINRGPVPTIGQDMDYRTDRSYHPWPMHTWSTHPWSMHHRRAHATRYHRRHLAQH